MLDFFASDLLQNFEFERFLFDQMILSDRKALERQLATSGAKAALIVFLNVIHNFLRDRAFAPASECYSSGDSNIVCLRLVCVPGGKLVPA
ncbi:MAG: hypothetical protein WBE80_11690, partial [Methylocella sp.]